MKKYKILMLLLLATANFQAFSVEGNNFEDLKIYGNVADSDFSKGESFVYIHVSKYGFAKVEQARTQHQKYEIECQSNGDFNISIQSPDELFYLHISYKSPNSIGNSSSWIDRVFIVNAGDSLYCNMDSENIDFSGLGSEKMNCQMELFKMSYSPSDSDMQLLQNSQYRDYILQLESNYDLALRKQLSIIDKHKNYLDKNVQDLLIANSYALKYTSIRGYNFILNQTEGYEAYKEELRKYYRVNDIFKKPPKEIDGILQESPLYANYCLETEIFKEFIYNNNLVKKSSAQFVQNIYERILNNYNGVLQDKIHSLFFLYYNQNPFAIEYQESAIRLIADPLYKLILESRNEKLAKGVLFQDFSLEDPSGNTITLSDFKNKVVLVDFWFTGCPGCLLFERAMKPVKDYFKDNVNIVFLKISVDKSRDLWLRTLKEGRYTDDMDLNVYTNGMGTEHPLINHYNIKTYPTVYILKDGSIFSPVPPRPELDRAGEPQLDGNTSLLIELLNNAISLLD